MSEPTSQDQNLLLELGSELIRGIASMRELYSAVAALVDLYEKVAPERPEGFKLFREEVRGAFEPLVIGTREISPIVEFSKWSGLLVSFMDIKEHPFGARYAALMREAATVGAEAIALNPITTRSLWMVNTVPLYVGKARRRPIVDAFMLEVAAGQEEVRKTPDVHEEEALQTVIVDAPRSRSDEIALTMYGVPPPSICVLATALRRRMPRFNVPGLMDDPDYPDVFKRYGVGKVCVFGVAADRVDEGVYEGVGRAMAMSVDYEVEHLHCVVTTATEWVFMVVVNSVGPDGERGRRFYRSETYEYVFEENSKESERQARVIVTMLLLWIKLSFEGLDEFMGVDDDE